MNSRADSTEIRRRARELASRYLQEGNPCGWFEPLYREAEQDPKIIPWADMKPNPNLVAWLNAQGRPGEGLAALVVGCGLGDDAEELASHGYSVTAFDLAQSAIDWCQKRFPSTRVRYRVADLFDPPKDWQELFDLVIEIYTFQVLQPQTQRAAMSQLARMLKPGGELLVICRAREAAEPRGEMPWPLSRQDFQPLDSQLNLVSFEDFSDNETPPVRRFRAVWGRDAG